MIKTKSVYEPSVDSDGFRVLVTRYWPRGVKKALVDEWCKSVGTPAELIKGYKAGGVEWAEFSAAYTSYLDSAEGREGLKELKALVKAAGKSTVTLLCSCKSGMECHREILKSVLERQGV